MSKLLRKTLSIYIELAKQGYLKNSPKLFGELLYDNSYIKELFFEKNNKQIFSQIALALEDKDRREFLAYCSTVYPIKYGDVKGLVKLDKRDGFVPVPVSYDLFKKLYRIDKGINSYKLNKIKASVEEVYVDNWAKIIELFLRWPRTDAPSGLESFFPNGWQTTGLLSMLGYHVGLNGESEVIRQEILSSIVEEDCLPPSLHTSYSEKWGDPNSLTRLIHLARTIAALCRNAKASPNDNRKAVLDWEADLDYLKNKYFYGFLNLEKINWPET